MPKKTLLITGASGFVGRNLIEQLAPRYELLTPKHQELDLTQAQAVEDYLKRHQPDVVVHLASRGVSRKDRAPSQAGPNLQMFFNLAHASRHFGRFIQFGSGAEYSRAHLPPRVGEEFFDSHVPGDEYGFCKYVCAKHIEHSENMVNLRMFGCFGKYEDYEIRFISNNIAKAVFGLPMTIANQNIRFSYLDVNDLGPILEHFIEKEPAQKSYNLTPDEPVDLLTIARTINEVSGQQLPIHVNRPGMGPEYSGSNRRLRQEIPNLKLTPIKESIRRLWDWYLEHRDRLDVEKLKVDRY